jgi:hypothetical protein
MIRPNRPLIIFNCDTSRQTASLELENRTFLDLMCVQLCVPVSRKSGSESDIIGHCIRALGMWDCRYHDVPRLTPISFFPMISGNKVYIF